jgi:hypothetical protein
MNDTEHRGQWDDSYGTRITSDGVLAPGRGLAAPIKVEGHGGHGEHGEAHH